MLISGLLLLNKSIPAQLLVLNPDMPWLLLLERINFSGLSAYPGYSTYYLTL